MLLSSSGVKNSISRMLSLSPPPQPGDKHKTRER